LSRSLQSRPSSAPPFEELLLALAHHHLGQGDEARRWLARAEDRLLDRESLRAGSVLAAGAGGSWAVLTSPQVCMAGPPGLQSLHQEVRSLLQQAQR
jgi:hypothetical protein